MNALPDLDDPEEEYNMAREKMIQHGKTCDGCTKEAIVAIKKGFKELAKSPS